MRSKGTGVSCGIGSLLSRAGAPLALLDLSDVHEREQTVETSEKKSIESRAGDVAFAIREQQLAPEAARERRMAALPR